MGHFDRGSGLYCQNDEVSPVGTRKMSRERVVRYPPGHRSKLLLVSRPHLTQRGLPGGILNGPVFRRFAGDYAANGYLGTD